MIFLTIGTQLPFDRLVETVDQVAADLDEEIFGQIGHGAYKPAHFEFSATLSPQDFTSRISAARIIIGHAGIGTLLSGKSHGKPVVIMARRHMLGEHRNDHQIATTKQLSRVAGVYVFEDAPQLSTYIKQPDLTPMERGTSINSQPLIERLRREISTAK